VIYAGTHGYADTVDLGRMREWENALVRFRASSHPEIGRTITDEQRITDDLEDQLKSALDTFKSTWL